MRSTKRFGNSVRGSELIGKFAFLHRLDSLSGEAELVVTEHARLREAVFLDGRTEFWDEGVLIALDELELVIDPAPLSFIFHVGFCGSTFLASLLDQPGERFVLKETQAISDLASQWPLLITDDKVDHSTRSLEAVVAALRSSCPKGETLILKPSCWANPLIPHLLDRSLIARALFLTSDWQSYLTACFRGGRERLSYCARFAELFAQHDPDMKHDLGCAIKGVDDPLDRMARIIILLHAWQDEIFSAASSTLGDDRARVLSFPASDEPIADQLAELIGLVAPGTQNPSQLLPVDRHAKDPTTSFDAQAQGEVNAEILRHHEQRFLAARAWLERDFPHRLSGEASR